MIPKLLLFTALVTFGSLPASAQNAIAITGAKLLTVTQGVIENGTLVVESGRIAAIGADVRVPPDARVIDARGKVVMPGMIDAGDELGLVEIPAEQITLDATEYTDPVHPELRVLDALNPRSELIRVTRAAGITNALSTPAPGNLIAGQSAFIQLDGETVEEIVVKSPAALDINLGEMSKSVYGAKGKPPDTRMGQMAMLRQAFLSAQHYRAVHEAYAKRQATKAPATEGDASSEAPGESRGAGPPGTACGARLEAPGDRPG